MVFMGPGEKLKGSKERRRRRAGDVLVHPCADEFHFLLSALPCSPRMALDGAVGPLWLPRLAQRPSLEVYLWASFQARPQQACQFHIPSSASSLGAGSILLYVVSGVFFTGLEDRQTTNSALLLARGQV